MPQNKRAQPLGVFDSGLGGLTVVKELIRQVPSEKIMYFGDTARVPYGTKSRESIIRFSRENARVLLSHRVKLIVVACNSSSSYAMESLRRNCPVPVVGVIEPGAAQAVAATKNKRVGVIATPATVNSGSYQKAVKKLDAAVKVYAQGCPLLVPLAEEGWFRKKVTEEIIREYLKPLRKARVDTIVLGCTHYPLLKTAIHKAAGKGVKLIDSATAVAGKVKELLTETSLENKNRPVKNKYRFFASDRPQNFEKIAGRFMGRAVNIEIV